MKYWQYWDDIAIEEAIKQLDKWFDAFKDFILATFAVVLFYFASVSSKTAQTSLLNLILGLSFIPIVFVFYKTATFKNGFRGLYSRARAILIILMFVFPWILISGIVIQFPTLGSWTEFMLSKISPYFFMAASFLLAGGYYWSKILLRYLLNKTQLQRHLVSHVLEFPWRPNFMFVYCLSISVLMQPIAIHLASQGLWFLSDYVFQQASLIVFILGVVGITLVYLEPIEYNIESKHDWIKIIIVIGSLLGFISIAASLIVVIPSLVKLKNRTKGRFTDYRYIIELSLTEENEEGWVWRNLDSFENHEFLLFSILVVSVTIWSTFFALYFIDFIDFCLWLIINLVMFVALLLLIYISPKVLKPNIHNK